MKNIIIFAIVVAGGYLAWQNFPGLRETVTSAANEYGGWTEEARKKDPVGYIEYAIKQLDGDVEKLTEKRTSLKESRANIETKLEEYREEEAESTNLANQIKVQFNDAEQNASWPITINGQPYDKSKAITLVNDILLTKKNASARLADYQGTLMTIEARSSELATRISESKFNREKLVAQKDIVSVDNLSAQTDELLANVNDLVEGNDKAAEEPALTYEDLKKDIDKQAKAEEKAEADSKANSAALDFLNG